MAIPAVNAVYQGQGPTESGQVVTFGGNSQSDFAIYGTVTFVLDGTLTAGQLNWIDGTKTLSFTPSRVFVFRTGGDALKSISAVSCTSLTNVKGDVEFSAAGSSPDTVILAFMAMR